MIGAQSSLYTLAVAVGLFSMAVLSGRRERDVVGRHRWLAGYLGLVTIGFGLEWAIAHPGLHGSINVWLGLRMVGSLLMAPLLWLAVRETVETRRPAWRDLNGFHLGAIVAGVGFTLPLLLVDSLGAGLERLIPAESLLHGRMVHTGMVGCIAIFAAQVPWYLQRCRGLVTATDAATVPRWLPALFVIVFTTWVLGLLRTAHCMLIGQDTGFALLFAAVEVVVAMAVFYLLVRRSALTVEAPPVAVSVASVPKYAKSDLSAVARQRIGAKLERVLQVDQVYRENDLTLAALSERLDEKSHHVSQVINRDYGTKLSGLLSDLRVAAARRALVETPDLTILEIALAVGFNSKSTFNAAFRKATGKTPSEFRASTRS